MINMFLKRLWRRRGKQRPPLVFARHPIELVMRILKSGCLPAYVVQVGAADGSENDPLSGYLQHDWIKSYLYEPLSAPFRDLEALHVDHTNVTCVNAAVSRESGHQKLFTVADNCPYAAMQLSSFYRQHLLENGVKQEHITEVLVPAFSLQDICREYSIPRVDLLQSDTEGYDAEIVSMGLELTPAPMFINFEHVHLSSSVRRGLYELLERKGYGYIHGEWDTLAWNIDEQT